MKVFTQVLAPNQATLTCYVQDQSPEMATADVRPAMLVFPGGGYFMCSDREAEPVALAYLAEGFNAFVLRYAVGKEETFDHALQDAQAALRFVRENAQMLRIDPQKVAVVGFSAGGHLAASLGTVSEEKPNALVLGYPVIQAKMGPPVGKIIAAADESVTEQTPPSFIFATSDDNVVPIENSLCFASALAKHEVYFEMHIYLCGEHGFSLGKAAQANGNAGTVNPDAAAWFAASIGFLNHVWGDFSLTGKPSTATLQEKRQYGLDMPMRRLLKNKSCFAAVEDCVPALAGMVEANPLAKGMSLRQLAKFSPEHLPKETLEALEIALQACNDTLV